MFMCHLYNFKFVYFFDNDFSCRLYRRFCNISICDTCVLQAQCNPPEKKELYVMRLAYCPIAEIVQLQQS